MYLLNTVTLGLALTVTLVIVEVALRGIFPAERHHYVIQPGARVVMHPESLHMPGVQGPSSYVINSAGVRGREFSPPGTPEYRILAVGGSTTELLYIDAPRSWPALIESSIGKTLAGEQVWVGNVGRSGLNARDHALEVKYLTREYPELDAVLVLSGVNDLMVALGAGDRYELPVPVTDPVAERKQIRRTFAVAPGSLAHPATEALLADDAPFYKATAVWQLMKRARFQMTSRFSQKGLVQDDKGETLAKWRAHRRQATAIIDELPDLELPLVEFRRNLNYIVDESSARSLRLVLLTQPTLWRADLTPQEQQTLWLGGASADFQAKPGSAYYSPRALAEAMHRFNQVTLEVCAARGVECIDLAAMLPKNAQTFYDDAHFTDCGSRVIAAAITEYVAQRPPFADRQVPNGARTTAGLPDCAAGTPRSQPAGTLITIYAPTTPR